MMPPDLDLGAEAIQLQDSVRKAMAGVLPHRALTTGNGATAPLAARHWALAVEMGWPGMMVAERDGGSGLGLGEVAAVSEVLGALLFCGPFATTAVLAVTLAELGRRQGRMDDVPAAIARGEMVVALAGLPDSGDWMNATPSLSVNQAGLSGARELVEHPDLATHFLAIDWVISGVDRVDLLAALVPAGPGISIAPRQPLDVTCPVARVAFEGAHVPPDRVLRTSMPRAAFDDVLRPFHVAIAAELVGLGQAALDRAIAHGRERKQFGVPIGSFQAIKHRLADCFVLLTHARLAVRHAAGAGDDPSSPSVARALAAEAALTACGVCIQVLGAMGFSWESDAHLYLKRARRLVSLFGDTPSFRQNVADRFIASVLASP